MHTKTGIHVELQEAQKAFRRKMSNNNLDPFVLLSTFVNGTGSLFPDELVRRVQDICALRDVKAYLELAQELDALSKSYESDTDVELVKGHRALCSFLKKFPFDGSLTPFDTKAAAVEKWHAAEDQCKDTNERLSLTAKASLPSWVLQARRLIEDALGPLDPSVIMKMLRDGEHGKGTTTETPYKASSVYFKYKLTSIATTSRARLYVKAAISLNKRWVSHLESSGIRKQIPLPASSPAYAESQLLDEALYLNEFERISFVPKDAKTMRPIGIGNSSNMYIQLGIKRYLTECLKRVGVDLTNQEKNQTLAKIGSMMGISLDGELDSEQPSTIDLASASDTVSLGICELLLPPLWYALLYDIRHLGGLIDGEPVVYNKMSAMGNGFTFPLESLIFWAVAQATAIEDGARMEANEFAVYGDDIIVPYKHARKLIENLEWSGFSVNSEKSFLSGAFKESCGADYFQGINVRPFYLKRGLFTPMDVYYVCNALLPRTLAANSGSAQGYRAVYQLLVETLSSHGPVTYRPLSDITQRCSHSGKILYFTSDKGLSVPLAYFNKKGIGYLTTREKVELYNKKMFPKVPKKWRQADLTSIIRNNVPYALQHTLHSVREKDVNEFLRYSLSLQSSEYRSVVDLYDSTLEKYCVDDSGRTVITIKGDGKLTSKLLPVPNWNGVVTKAMLLQHPVL